MRILQYAIVLVFLCSTQLTLAEEGILKRLQANDITNCSDCAEIAEGVYYSNGTEKPFILLRRLQKNITLIYFGFTNPLGEKYVINSRYNQESDKVGTAQAVLIPDIDLNSRPRSVQKPLYENLGNTFLTPVFLTLSLHLIKKYTDEATEKYRTYVKVKKEAQFILPHKIFVRYEEHEGNVAPIEVIMYRDDNTLSTIHIKNAMVNGRLRPFWMSLTSRNKTHEIRVTYWGIVEYNNIFFTPIGLSRGDLSIPKIQQPVDCPSSICK